MTIEILRVRTMQVCLLLPFVALAGCTSFQSASSPDVIYSEDAPVARQLQVPPDLTDISDNEQFILPGTGGGPVTRNTLLPAFESVRFVRNGEQNWLAIDQAPETIWPQLLAFLRRMQYGVEQTEPAAGIVVTQWRASGNDGQGGILKNLIGSDADFSRVAFRLERDGSGARLFARSQAGSKDDVAASKSGAVSGWPAESHDPEATSALLTRLLLFIGVQEQKARGILNNAQLDNVLDDAIVQTTASGSQLIVNLGYQPAFRAILGAVQLLDYPVLVSDDSIGRIEFSGSAAVDAAGTSAVADADSSDAASAASAGGVGRLILELKPVHISAVVVELSDAAGQRLPDDRERELLTRLLELLV